MEKHATTEENFKKDEAASLKEKTPMPLNFIKVYPSDFIHGLLSAHVAEETGCVAGKCPLKEDSKVTISKDNELYSKFIKEKDYNINESLKNWFIEKIIDDKETGYCGIIYKSIVNRNIVLAHRSTNFKLGFGSNLLKQSGVQADYQTVMLGILVPHMAYGQIATKKAVEISKKLNFTLSFTGHSLGSFLAEMSIFYCNYELNFRYVKAVVFDGPGCWDLMNKLNENLVKNVINRIKLEDLDITSYITAPNMVNCCNSHIGKTYTIFPKLEKDSCMFSKIIQTFGKKIESGMIATILGHDLLNILPYFDRNTGKPIESELVLRWPKITHKEFGTKKFNDSLVSTIFKAVTGSKIIKGFLNNFISGDEVISTIESMAYVLQDFLLGKIKMEQFWNVHKLLNIDNNFMKPLNLNPVEEFNLVYKLHYQLTTHNEYELELNDTSDSIDRFLKLTKEKEEKLKFLMNSIENVVPFWNYYNYYPGFNKLHVDIKFRDKITVSDLRDYMRYLLFKKPELLNRLSSNENALDLLPDKINHHIKIDFLKNYYLILEDVIEKERMRYLKEEDYLNLLNSEEIERKKFLGKTMEDLIYKKQIVLYGRTNAGKSTLGNRILSDDEKSKLFFTSQIAETFAVCEILIDEKVDLAKISITYTDETSEIFDADSKNNLIKLLEKYLKKNNTQTNNKKAEQAKIISPKEFFPRFKSGTSLVDTPGFSEDDIMKKYNTNHLSEEKHRSIIIFLIPLEIGGSLMQENLDILQSYEKKDSDVSNNIIFVLTKLKNFKTLCENENPDNEDQEILEEMNKKLEEGFINPIKKKYPFSKIIIYEIGRDMDKYFYDTDTLQLKLASYNDLKGEKEIDLKTGSMKHLNYYIDSQFINNEVYYYNALRDELLTSINNIKGFMFNFHNEEKKVKENKQIILEKLNEILNKTKSERMNYFKSEIYNKEILWNFVEETITKSSFENKEKCINSIDAKIQSLIENYLFDISYNLEDIFYDHLFFHVMRELPSDKSSVLSKVIKMRKEIADFLSAENLQKDESSFLDKIGYFFSRFIPKIWRSELDQFKLDVYDSFNKNYLLEGKEISEFFKRLSKRLPAFVDLIGLQYKNQTYCGKSNDLNEQLTDLIELVKKFF
jgi:hypothetical protein